MTKHGRGNYHLRELPSIPFCEQDVPQAMRAFVEAEVLPRIAFKGYKLREKHEIAVHAIHNLVMTGLVAACVSDERDTKQAGTRRRVEVWDAIVDAGLAKVCLGSQEAGRVTRYRATGELLDLRSQWELRMLVNLDLARNSESSEPTPFALIYLHTGKIDLATGRPLPKDGRKLPVSLPGYVEARAQRTDDGVPDPRAIENGLEYFREVEDTIDRINRCNTRFSWQAFVTDLEAGKQRVVQPNVCLRQVHVGAMFRACRLYSWSALSGQSLTKEQRRTILIDGEQSAELDFSGLATRMLYHFAKLDPPGDVYKPDQVMPKIHGFANLSDAKRTVLRGFVKRATNICWNVKSQVAANSAVGKLMAEHPDSEFLRHAIYDAEETDPKGVVLRIMAAHPDLHDQFFTEVGLELMTADGKIILHILNEFAQAGKPALGIHDSLVCRASDAEFACDTMAQVYSKFMQFEPVINRVY